jgi:hypothetical protein
LAEPSGLFSYTPQSSPNLMSPALATSSFNRDNTRIRPPWASSALRVVRLSFLAKKSLIAWTLMHTLTGSSGCSRLWAANSPQRLRPQYLPPGPHPVHQGPHAQLLGDSQGFVQQAVDAPLNALACHYRGILASQRKICPQGADRGVLVEFWREIRVAHGSTSFPWAVCIYGGLSGPVPVANG